MNQSVLCRYITRPAIANERLKRNRAGQVVLQLKSPYKDGTTHIVMEPLEFMERLAALVPRPRLHLIRFHGVLAPNAKLRSKIVPAPAERAAAPPTDHARKGNLSGLAITHCPNPSRDPQTNALNLPLSSFDTRPPWLVSRHSSRP